MLVSESPTSPKYQPKFDAKNMAYHVLDYYALDSSEFIQSKTIKLEEELAKYPILLINNGVSHNFIACLEVTPTKAFSVGFGK